MAYAVRWPSFWRSAGFPPSLEAPASQSLLGCTVYPHLTGPFGSGYCAARMSYTGSGLLRSLHNVLDCLVWDTAQLGCPIPDLSYCGVCNFTYGPLFGGALDGSLVWFGFSHADRGVSLLGPMLQLSRCGFFTHLTGIVTGSYCPLDLSYCAGWMWPGMSLVLVSSGSELLRRCGQV